MNRGRKLEIQKLNIKMISLISFFLFVSINIPAQDYHRFIEYQYKKQTYPETSSDLSQSYVFIGMYKQALLEEEKKEYLLQYKFSDNPNAKPKKAYPYIYNAIKKNRIVILNETHNIPLNRVLLYDIIDSLHYLGLNSIFIETLAYTSNDSIYSQSYPVEDWGYYTSENIFRQVMHKLKKSGLHLYSYEKSFNDLDTMTIQERKCIISKTDTKWIPIMADDYVLSYFLSDDSYDNREAQQALKIYQKLEREAISKALIYCGYGHAWRQGGNMIDILEHLLKTEVYTIDQTLLNERINRNLENHAYTQFATADYPFVVVDKQNQPLHSISSVDKTTSYDKFVDLVIGSPRSIYINNRPTWLELNGDRKRYNLLTFMDGSTYTDFLVCFYTPEELQKKKEEYIPDDVFQVFGNAKDYDAILKPNKQYQLIATKDGKEIINKTIITK